MSTSLGAGVAIGVMMVVLGMEPRPVLVGFVVAAVGAVAFLVAEVGPTATSLRWHDHATVEDAGRPPDKRVRSLQTRLHRNRTRRRVPTIEDGSEEPEDEIAVGLVGLIDDQLVAEHGVDRSRDPDGAARVLGPDLTRFVTDPAARRSMTRRRSLARTLELIEDL